MNIFVENNLGYKVQTPQGYVSFSGVAYRGLKKIFRIEFSQGSWVECSENHRFISSTGEEVYVSSAKMGQDVQGTTGVVKILTVIDTGKVEDTYDLIDVNGNVYFTNNILSHNCEFLTAEETLINSIVLQRLEGKEPKWSDGLIRWFERPHPNRVYLVGLDPSTGTGGDRAAIQVFMLPEMKQIAEWCDNKSPPRVQVEILHKILHFIKSELAADMSQKDSPDGSIYWTFENNGVGEAISSLVSEFGEDRFPGFYMHEPKRAGIRTGRKGLTTSHKPKIAACTKLKSLIESNRIEIQSKPMIVELKNYVRRSNSFEAKQGSTDDLVSAAVLAIRLAEIIKEWDPKITERLREVLDTESDEASPLPFIMSVSF